MMDQNDYETWLKSLKIGDKVQYCVYGNSWRITDVIKVNRKSIITSGNLRWTEGSRKLNHVHIVRIYPVTLKVPGMSYI